MKLEKQKIIDKVIKLLALAEGTEHGPEAEAAKSRAADLMAKYDINIMEAKEKPAFETVENVLTRKTPKKYEKILTNCISIFNGVAYIVHTCDGPGKDIFAGTGADLLCNDYMLDVVKQQRTAAWESYAAEYKAVQRCPPSKKDRSTWFMGFSFGISAKLRELREMKENKIQEYGIVPVDQYKQSLAHYEEDNSVRNMKSRPSSYSNAGFDAGKSAHIHKGVNQSGSTKLIA